ncbi:MAG TPA: hypothetical protein VGF52_05365 [Tepidisphaeraceae bacterium]|jgi:TolA-binding protein
MSSVYNPEADTVARIEQLELQIRNLRRKIEHAHTPADKRALNKQISELRDETLFLIKQLNK